MSKINRTGKPKVLYFTDPLISMAQRFIDERGVVSFSEVIRRSLEFYYFEEFKAAYEPTAKDHEKKKALAEEARLRAMTDKEFGEVVCRGVVAKGKEGRLFVILHTAFNSLFAVPASEIKKWPKAHPDEFQSHLTALKSKTTQEQFRYSAIRSFLTERWGIQFDENEQLIS